MDVILAPIGSLGDVLPYCALARELVARGHRVAVAANPHFAAEVARAGVDYLAVGDEEAYLRLTATPDCVDGARGFGAIMRYVSGGIPPLYEVIATHRPHKVVAHPLALAAHVADEKLGIEAITTYLSPAILQSAHLPPVTPPLPNGERFPRWYKRAVAWTADRVILDRAVAPALNALRSSLGLPRGKSVFRHRWQQRRFVALFPEWFAPRQPDWPRQLTQTGFPAGDEGTLPPELAPFLDGDAVVFTPGTGNRHAPRFFAAAIAATARIERRALLLTRFAEHLPSPLPAHACWVPWAPLGPLLRHAAALVHHGGIGTSAAALRAGVPQLVMPLAHDQPDNAARLERLGVGDTLLPRRFRERAVAASLGRLLDSPDVAARCAKIAGHMAGRNGLSEAADVIAGHGSALRLSSDKGASP